VVAVPMSGGRISMTDLERQRLERAHRDAEAKLQLGISLAGFGLGIVDYAAGLITLDDVAADLLLLPAQTAMPQAELHKLFHPGCARRIADGILAAQDPAGQGFLALEHRVILPDGRVRWMAVRKQTEFSDAAPGAPRVAMKSMFAIRDITDRKAADDKVRVSEIRYRRLFEAAHDGVLLLDPVTAKIVDANPFMTRLLGYGRAELVGRELFEIGLLKDRVASQDMVTELSRTHEVRYENLPLETTDGLHRAVEVVANLYDEDGHAIIQCNIRDITERRLLEAGLRQNSQLLSTLIEQAPSGVYLIDAQFRMAQINPVAMPAFKHIEPLIGRDFAEILEITLGPVVGRQIECIFKHTLATGERYVSPPFSEMRDDLRVTQAFEWEIQRVTLIDGQHGVVCYFKDVTEQRHAEDIITERARHVRSILDNTQAFIGLLAIDGTLLEANISALSAAGAAREQVIGRKLWDDGWWANQPDEVARLKDAVRRAAQGEIVRYDMVLNPAGIARMDVDFMLAPIWDAAGKITLLVPSGLDITDRKKSLDRIQLLMGEVNHRAMNLLGVVLAVARQTMRAGDPATFVARLTERITGLAASQDLLVQNEWQGVDVGDLVRAQLSHYREQFDTGVRILGLPARLTAAAAQGIGMALHELATNAGKYGSLSVSGGKVDVTWTLIDPTTFEMIWRESGGPEVATPTRKGFGQKVIGPMVEAAVNGQAKLDYAAAGFSWTLTAPVSDTMEKYHDLLR
jgi:PAS domain S-box-containing protein